MGTVASGTAAQAAEHSGGDKLTAVVQSLVPGPDCLDQDPAPPLPAVTLGSSPNLVCRWKLITVPISYGYWGHQQTVRISFNDLGLEPML